MPIHTFICVFVRSASSYCLAAPPVVLMQLNFRDDKFDIHVSCLDIRGMFEMNCLLSNISISTWGRIKTNIYLSRFIQGLHNGV